VGQQQPETSQLLGTLQPMHACHRLCLLPCTWCVTPVSALTACMHRLRSHHPASQTHQPVVHMSLTGLCLPPPAPSLPHPSPQAATCPPA
jgi:hypothetical protein